MCGIFGLAVHENSTLDPVLVESCITRLALLSESRGKDSSGFALRDTPSRKINVIRASMPISSLMKHPAFVKTLQISLSALHHTKVTSEDYSFATIGHSRLVTNGTQLDDKNNQPVIKDGMVAVHNGIIVNVDELWQSVILKEREYDIDTEVMLALFKHFNESYDSSISSISKVCSKIVGTVSTGVFIDNKNELLLATNNGSLYILSNYKDVIMFASERYILERLVKLHNLTEKIPGHEIKQLAPNTGCLVDLGQFKIDEFNMLNEISNASVTTKGERFHVELQSINGEANTKSLLVEFEGIISNPNAGYERQLLENNEDKVKKLLRCTKCVLPETFPFISFDSEGVCNYCRNYKVKNQSRPLSDLMDLVKPYRKKDGKYDCIVPFSGGRDSTFTLHMVKKVLGLNPIAFTYDWGMVTDLARRNIARVCGELGVENVIVAADIRKKRRNIRNNIYAWLKRPALGMIPLFMSGDKYFFYYTNQLKKQTGIELNIWGINNLENTDFKTGFAGVRPSFDKKRIYSMSIADHLIFYKYVGMNFIKNPAYFNSSNIDSIGSILSRYMFPQKSYYSFFDYYQWNEREIEDLILSEYDWEKAIDTNSTWRIGDGTASFYNYIYYTVAGFSENDTFRSNQIREGLCSREEALEKIEDENMSRYENIRWYLDIVGVDYKDAIMQINSIPKLY